jgi:hypothetical protein
MIGKAKGLKQQLYSGGGEYERAGFARSAVGHAPQGRAAREAKPYYSLSYS